MPTKNEALERILDEYRIEAATQRDSGALFEDMMIVYFKNEPKYKEDFKEVQSYADWVSEYGEALGISHGRDAGIDLVATTYDGKHYAIQCKNYQPSHKMAKRDIDSFMSASSKTYFSHRIIVSTATEWGDNAEDMIQNQHPPVITINLSNLRESVIDWDKYYLRHVVERVPKKVLRTHQQEALDCVVKGLQSADRGKLIMACGTGKTFTALKIAEEFGGRGKKVLFMVPSLALLSQTLNEWSQQSNVKLRNFAVCSDSYVGKKGGKSEDDLVIATQSDLDFPATTKADRLAIKISTLHDPEYMTVVYSTYHSIDVISEAQSKYGLDEFDLVICDEAHRTTGAKFGGEDESAFTKIHSNENIKAKKRLYMTATPRIYGEKAKVKSAQESIQLCSMDDESKYGQDLYVINFSQAVDLGLLVDYKVVVLAVEEAQINRHLQKLLSSGDNELKVDDAAKIVGCWKALAKYGFEEESEAYEPMKRAVAFCQVIEANYRGKKHKVSSKVISSRFSEVVKSYQKAEKETLEKEDPDAALPAALRLECQCEHVDGSMNASEKQAKIDWLKDDVPHDTCHILSNVRCLSEGVDVPALDAVMFLTPRNSQIDVVQSVGRVMRKAPGKKMGYVILPVVIPAGVEPEQALDNNETFKVVWQVLNALRSHDNKFDAMINKLELNGGAPGKMEVVMVTDKVSPKTSAKTSNPGTGSSVLGQPTQTYATPGDSATPEQPDLPNVSVTAFEKALYAKVVRKCGNRHHWEDWAGDVAKIAQTHIDRIHAIIENPENKRERRAFKQFVKEVHADLNRSVTEDEVIEMFAQHLITRPVFDALFSGNSFASYNPMSIALQKLLDLLNEHRLDKEARTLDSFYESVKMRAIGITTAQGRQQIIIELYDKFFKNAFPRLTERLGIVYTPTEVVDFIIHSVEHALQTEFKTSLADENVHILDPFTGTGTFITRLLQSGIIPLDKLTYKYQHEIHANEIVLLAYYIAAINIETTYHSLMAGGNVLGDSDAVKYLPFEGICLTDTFQMYESAEGEFKEVILEENSERRRKQQALDIKVIIGNPPYSAGQKNANDNNANIEYAKLNASIRDTYTRNSNATSNNSDYDSYKKALRWSSDRVGDHGVIGFVTNGSFIDASNSDGVRKCLAKEFSKLYIFHLRGNQRTSGETSRKEGGKIFAGGSRAPIAISILVKNRFSSEHGKIYFFDIGDYLTREEKLNLVETYQSIAGIPKWESIVPNEFADWVNQRNTKLLDYMLIGDKKGKEGIFQIYSRGIATGRDAWAYNYGYSELTNNMQRMINNYNSELHRFNESNAYESRKERMAKIDNFVDNDQKKISWSRSLKQVLARNTPITFDRSSLYQSLYRPFSKQWLYFSRELNEMIYLMPQIFPTPDSDNLVIQVSGVGAANFSVLMSDKVPCLGCVDAGQCFPLHLYRSNVERDSRDIQLSLEGESEFQKVDAISEEGLKYFQDGFPGDQIDWEDIFYYIYGLLHSEDYRQHFSSNLDKELPRIPLVKTYKDFQLFSNAGRQLAELHVNYEKVEKYPADFSGSAFSNGASYESLEPDELRVTKMRFGKINDTDGKSINDLSTIIYNENISLSGIPLEAYQYELNGRSAIACVMERQLVKLDGDSGIENNANDWAVETEDNPAYPLELLLRVITVSLKTVKIVQELPDLDIG